MPLKYEICKRDIATYLKPIRDIPERKHVEFFYGLDNFPKVRRLLPKNYQLSFGSAKQFCEIEMEKCFSVLYVLSIIEKIKAKKVVFEQNIEINSKKWSLDWTLGIILKNKKKLR